MVDSDTIELLWSANKNLEEISAKLDRLIFLYEFSQKRKLKKFKEDVIGRSNIRKEIYNLCDGTKTVNELSKLIRKSLPHTSKELAVLEEAGIITSKDVGGRKKYYVKVF
jgi:DNA-binding transcriptional ArsR family regulator